jgi:hypothetical protein
MDICILNNKHAPQEDAEEGEVGDWYLEECMGALEGGGYNRIEAEGAESLAGALAQCPALAHLNLNGTEGGGGDWVGGQWVGAQCGGWGEPLPGTSICACTLVYMCAYCM